MRDGLKSLKEKTIKKMNVRIFRHEDFEEPSLSNQIGSGGFGTVYKLHEKETGKLYAVKVLNEEIGEFFFNEISIIKTLNYPTLLHFQGITDQYPYYIITEYIPNQSVQYYIDKSNKGESNKEWDLTHKIIIIIGMSLGLQYLHSMNIAHRDIKPGNILLDSNFYPVLCDFGLSKNISQSEKLVTRGIGTPLFCAPEVMDLEEVDDYDGKKADIYSFGMTIYSILFDKIPFDDNLSEYELRNKIINGDRPKLEEGYISEKMKNLIKSCWDMDPDKRPEIQDITKILLEERIELIEMGKIEEEGIIRIKNFLIFCKEYKEEEYENKIHYSVRINSKGLLETLLEKGNDINEVD